MLEQLFREVLENSQEYCFHFCYSKHSNTRDFLGILSNFSLTVVLRNTSGRLPLSLRLSVETVVMVFCSTDTVADNIRRAAQKNSRKLPGKKLCWCVFFILATKALYDGQFPGNFPKHFRITISRNSFGRLLFDSFFFHGSSRPKVLEKLL